MAKGNDERHNPNRRVDKSSYVVEIADLETPQTMDTDKLMDYGKNIAQANESDDVPNRTVTSVEQAIENAVWAGDRVK